MPPASIQTAAASLRPPPGARLLPPDPAATAPGPRGVPDPSKLPERLKSPPHTLPYGWGGRTHNMTEPGDGEALGGTAGMPASGGRGRLSPLRFRASAAKESPAIRRVSDACPSSQKPPVRLQYCGDADEPPCEGWSRHYRMLDSCDAGSAARVSPYQGGTRARPTVAGRRHSAAGARPSSPVAKMRPTAG